MLVETRAELLLVLAFIIVASYFSLGIHVLVYRSKEMIARVFAGICFSLGGVYFLNFYLYVPNPDLLAQAELPMRLRWMLNSFGPALYLHLSSFYFPQTLRKVIGKLLPFIYLLGGVLALIVLFTDYFVAGLVIRPTQMAYWMQGPWVVVYWALLLIVFSIGIFGLASSLLRTRSSIARRQILYLLLPQVLIVILIFVFGDDSRALEASIIPNEVGQALLLVALMFFARGVLVYGSVTGRPIGFRRYLMLVLFYLLVGFVITALLTLDTRLTRYTAISLPLLTTLFIVVAVVFVRSADKQISQWVDRVTSSSPNSTAVVLESDFVNQFPMKLDESQQAERFLQTVCRSFDANGGIILVQEDGMEGEIVASWRLPYLKAGTTIDLPALPVQEPQLITSVWPYVPAGSIWQDMVLIVPLTIKGLPAKLILTEKENGQPYTYQEIEACGLLPDLYDRIEKSSAVGDNGSSRETTLEKPEPFIEPGNATPEVIETAVSAEKKAAVAIYALRSLEVYRFGKRVAPSEWGSEKALGMLAYLLWKETEGASREELSEALWPEKTMDEAANVFHVTLHRLRNVLEPTRKRGSSYVLFEFNRYHFHMDETVWLDLHVLEKVSEQENVRTLIQAVDLYHAGYLEDVAWALPAEAEIERRRYERLYENALRILIQKLAPREREIYLYRLLQLVPANQEAHELLLADYLTTDRIDLAKTHMEKLRNLTPVETKKNLTDL